MKIYKILPLIMLVPLLLSGCGSKSSASIVESSYDATDMGFISNNVYTSGNIGSGVIEESNEINIENDYDTDTEGNSKEIELSNSKKLIKNVDLMMQTKNFDKFLGDLNSLISEHDGYIENSYISGQDYYYINNPLRNATYTIRIPSTKLDDFMSVVGDLGNVCSKNESVKDVSLQYYDTEAQKEALEIEQDRLMEILKESESIDQIISIEQRLSEVRYELNSLGSTLRRLDNQVSYSTVNIDVSEVEVEISSNKDKTIFETISENWAKNFVDLEHSFKELIIAMVSSLPVIVLEIIFAYIIVLFIRKRKKSKKEAEKIKKEHENLEK